MPDQLHSDRWISLREVCAHLGVKRHTVMRWIEQRDMPASKVGKLWRFQTSEVDAWVRRGGASGEREGSE